MRSIYDSAEYPTGVLNPLGPREHAWNTEAHNQGTRYHGPIYDRPMAAFPWGEKPLWGVGQDEMVMTAATPLKSMIIGGVIALPVGIAIGWLIGKKRKS